MKNEKGFTLIEALVSLAVLSIVSLMSFTFVLNLHDYIRLNQVLSTFQADLHHARDFNMMQLNNDGRITIRIHHHENKYEVLINDVVATTRVFPTNISAPHQNAISNISFNERGNLGLGRTLIFTSRYHERRVVFSVGAGGFDVR